MLPVTPRSLFLTSQPSETSAFPLSRSIINANLSSAWTRREKKGGFIFPFCLMYKFLESPGVFVLYLPRLSHWNLVGKILTNKQKKKKSQDSPKMSSATVSASFKDKVHRLGGSFWKKFGLCHTGFLRPPPPPPTPPRHPDVVTLDATFL